ncbi:PQQ-binding-like beta-propeller repeat protein [Streptomyces sp. JH14]|uniref:outer membrane protein assembly factor BamB family protein n=1 Tax=Streptomyces sp. JH14 TaxID=2793630 RepID=UPI0023F70A78|nr:PQQ-binding-like beta-propeller repeat protein [Streptomyces sp. JH14]MDF6043010.1 PQQ-binding-like beta-propeller repeat protein [Streptomyces sp. JH14]
MSTKTSQPGRRSKLWAVGVSGALALGALASWPAGAAVLGGHTAPGGHAKARVSVQPDWASAGQNNHNTRYAATEHTINSANVGKLKPKWTFTAAGNISATATVVKGVAYVPDWGGKLWAINTTTGKAIWSRDISSYNGIPGDVSRTSPAYSNGELVIGTGAQGVSAMKSAYIVGIDARTGKMRWRTKVDKDPATIITSSPTVDNGVVYFGTSSKGETLSGPQTFRGSIIAASATTGKILWKTYTIPKGYTGGAMWGSQPVVDHKTGNLFVATGNNYTTPDGVCTDPGQADCIPPVAENHIDSILALNLKSGKIKWARPTLSADTWTVPVQNGAPDYDFGSAPNLYTTTVNGKRTDLLGIGQKSGIYWALNPATGKVVWKTEAGPGGSLGGIEWGSATDGKRIYAAIANASHKTYTVTSYDGKKTTTTGGLWAALDAATGKIVWQTADPQGGYVDDAFVSAANGVVYAGSGAPTGNNMYALDAETGQIKWAFPSGGSVWAGASVVDGNVYWGSGYRTAGLGLGYKGDNDKLYAFSLNGK